MKKYNIIYADPPWSYKKGTPFKKAPGFIHVSEHYNTMGVNEIKELPIKDLAGDNCTLFLWVTFPNLKEGLQVIEAWGFKYKTIGFSRIKTNSKSRTPFFGIGYYTKSNCEVCLIGTKGTLPIKSNKVSSVVISPRREHSRKPDEVREKIVELYGDLPRIELFARETSPGWDVWGNEVECSINFEAAATKEG
jgi:N6-adenosine-specific RNA methylase IME4